MTQRELAERMTAAGQKMLQTTVAKIEAAERPASITEAVTFAAAFGVGVEDLVRSDELYFDSVVNREWKALKEAHLKARLKIMSLRSEMDRLRATHESTKSAMSAVAGQLSEAMEEAIEIEKEMGELESLRKGE